MAPTSSIERQLFANQLWETIGFLAKAAFMLGLTPLMIRHWGNRGYGEFALASSIFALLSILDFGIRGRTRLALCRGHNSSAGETSALFSQSIVAFAIIAISAIGFVALLNVSHLVDNAIGISASNHHLLLATTAMTMLVLLSGLLLEPLVAMGKIGRLKLATSAGWVLATPAVATVLVLGGSATSAIVTWLGGLLLANILAALSIRIDLLNAFPTWKTIRPSAVLESVRGGLWFNVTNTTWIARTYGTPLLVAILHGPASAGFVFILLRLSEIISAVGAISCDVSLGVLARGTNVVQRRRSFASTFSWAVLLCGHSALLIGFATPEFYALWLHPASRISLLAGVVVASLGIGSAFNRTATYAAMGLDAGRSAAIWGLLEALGFLGLLVVLPKGVDLLIRLGLASLSACALLPLAAEICRRLEAPAAQIWGRPLVSLVPFLGASAAVLLLASTTERLLLKVLGVSACGVIFSLNIIYLRKMRSTRSLDRRVRTVSALPKTEAQINFTAA